MTCLTRDDLTRPGWIFVADYPPAFVDAVADFLDTHEDRDVHEIGRRLRAAAHPVDPSEAGAGGALRSTVEVLAGLHAQVRARMAEASAAEAKAAAVGRSIEHGAARATVDALDWVLQRIDEEVCR